MFTFTPTSRLHAAACPPARGRVARILRRPSPRLPRSAPARRPNEGRSFLAEPLTRARAKDDEHSSKTAERAPMARVPARAAAGDEGTRTTRRSACFHLVGTCASSIIVSGVIVGSPLPARAANDAVLAALQKKQTSDQMEGGAVQTRLNVALDELKRAQTLASVGEYADARAMLRKGALEKTRTDLRQVASYLRVQRPTFDQFEGLAVTGGLDAFDNAMRAVQQGVTEVTQRDVDVNARAAVSALEEVCYLLGKDTTYEKMKQRLEGGEEKSLENAARRDFLAEERAALADARIGAE